MADYYNVKAAESALKGLANTYPKLTSLITLPNTTHEGRTSYALHISAGNIATQNTVLVIGGMHGCEWGSCEIGINFAADLLEAFTLKTSLKYGGKSFSKEQIQRLFADLQLIIFPLVNPDGRNYSQTMDSLWRKNRRPLEGGCIGVDISRNFDFLWDFPNLFAPDSGIRCSTNPCDGTYHGPAPFSEAENQNVRWLLDTYPQIVLLVDLHCYSELVLYPWGDDNNQSSDPSMNYRNPAYNSLRGAFNKDDAPTYKEYIPFKDLVFLKNLSSKVVEAIKTVRGKEYTAKQSYELYCTSGTSIDYFYSRGVFSLGIEWGTSFQPDWPEMEKIILDISAGLVGLCVELCPKTKIRDLGALAWAFWIMIMGGLLVLTPKGPLCLICGPTSSKITGILSILIGITALVSSLQRLPGSRKQLN